MPNTIELKSLMRASLITSFHVQCVVPYHRYMHWISEKYQQKFTVLPSIFLPGWQHNKRGNHINHICNELWGGINFDSTNISVIPEYRFLCPYTVCWNVSCFEGRKMQCWAVCTRTKLILIFRWSINLWTVCSVNYSVGEEKDTCLCPITFAFIDFILFEIIKSVHHIWIKLTYESAPNYFFTSAMRRTVSKIVRTQIQNFTNNQRPNI